MIKINIIHILIFFSFTIVAQQPLSLQRAISIGLENNHNIEISELQIQIAENNNSWARAGRTPTITADVRYNNNLTKENNQASFLRGEYYTGSISPSLNLSWTLYNGGLTGNTKESLETNVLLQKQLSATTVQQTIVNIQQAYYDVLLQESRLNTIEDVMALSKDRLAYEETRKEFGSSNTFSLIQFEDAFLTDTTTYTIQTNQVTIARRNLIRAMNEDVNVTYYNLTDNLSIVDDQLDANELESTLLDSNPDLKTLDLNRRLAAVNTRIEQSFRKPTVTFNTGLSGAYNIFKSYGTDPNTGESIPTRTGDTYRLTAAVSASYLLYDGGVRNSNIENARLNESIAELDILETTAALKTQLKLLVDNYNNQLSQLEILDSQLDNAIKNLQISEERLKTGTINSLDYRQIQNAFTNVSFNRTNTIYNLLAIRTDIAYLIGEFAQ